MQKKDTKEIQIFLTELGEKLGFVSKAEYRKHITTDYNPIYDVVWFFEKESYNFSYLDKILDKEKNWKSMTNQIPIAAFEIEGSTTTSKNQLGNLLNLSLLNPFLSFVVVNNEKASNENDTYRRGVKIVRTYMEFSGKQNIIFLDWDHLANIEKSLDFSQKDKKRNNYPNNLLRRSKVGGEKDTVLMDNLMSLLNTTKLEIHQNYTSPLYKWQYSRIMASQNIKISKDHDYQLHKKYIFDPKNNIEKEIQKIDDFYYLPKIDFALELKIPNLFKMFLTEIGNRLQEQIIYYPILNYLNKNPKNELSFPFIGIEVETSVNKHLNGGVFNMSHFFYIGLLISKKAGLNNINTLSKLGINNIFHVNEEVLL